MPNSCQEATTYTALVTRPTKAAPKVVSIVGWIIRRGNGKGIVGRNTGGPKE